jgi:putative MATE family efflux protein
VRTLRGDPKKAIIKLSVPMIVAMSVQTIYTFVDGVWVSGLGPDALAAIGFFFPFFFILIAVATGISVGGAAALSRRIGSRDKEGSDNVAIHSLILMMIAAVLITVPFLIVQRPLFEAIGAGRTLDLVLEYGTILFASTAILFFGNWGMAILRGEGDVKRTMYAMVISSVLNIVLDPFFIFSELGGYQIGLGWGVAGAAWATVIAMSVNAALIGYWMFVKRDTYVTMRRCCFSYSRPIVNDIMKVGLPATVMQLAMSFSMIILNLIIVGIGGTDGIAVFTTGWRVVMVAILPLLGIATAVTSVTGAAFGERDYEKLDTGYMYAIRIGFMISVVTAVATHALAAPTTALFTTGEGGERIADDLTAFLQVMVLFFPAVAFGMFSSAMFQGTGKGMSALAVTILRTIVFTVVFALLLTRVFGMGLDGVWWGMIIGNLAGSVVAFAWGKLYVNGLKDGTALEEAAVTPS